MENPIFEVRGIPQTLKLRTATGGQTLTIEQVETIMEHNQRAIIHVSGDCLEAAQVVDGGWVEVDFTRFPAPPRYKSKGGDGSEDICLCYAVYPGQDDPTVMIKAYDGVWGTWQLVGTRYDLAKGSHCMNCGMEAIRIFGVVIASWEADGKILWKREPDSFPERLGTTHTVHGVNCGKPIPFGNIGIKRAV